MDGAVASHSSGAAAVRAEIDTSAPFESVKEAVDRFGGSAVWKSQPKQLVNPEVSLLLPVGRSFFVFVLC